MDKLTSDAFHCGLRGMWSHPDPLDVIESIDFETVGAEVEGYPLTIWQLSRHLMEWGWLILNKLKDVRHPFDTDENNFFPIETAPPSPEVWAANKKAFNQFILQCQEYFPRLDPTVTYEEWDNTNALELVITLITHTSYHIGQIVALLKLQGKWNPKQIEFPL